MKNYHNFIMDDSTFSKRVGDHVNKVTSLAQHYVEPLNRAFNAAHVDLLRMHGPMMRLYNNRDYANNMHVHLRDQVKQHFANVPEAYFDEKPNRSFKLLIDGRKKGIDVFLAFILKKQGRGYRTANIPTKTVAKYSQQIINFLDFQPAFQDSLFDLTGSGKTTTVTNVPACANLVAGYQMDPTWSAFTQLAITMPISLHNIRLLADFTQVTAEQVAEIVDMPMPQTEQKTSRIRRRAADTPKRQTERRFIEESSTDVPESTNVRSINEGNR